jgi:hypothetical protein
MISSFKLIGWDIAVPQAGKATPPDGFSPWHQTRRASVLQDGAKTRICVLDSSEDPIKPEQGQ